MPDFEQQFAEATEKIGKETKDQGPNSVVINVYFQNEQYKDLAEIKTSIEPTIFTYVEKYSNELNHLTQKIIQENLKKKNKQDILFQNAQSSYYVQPDGSLILIEQFDIAQNANTIATSFTISHVKKNEKGEVVTELLEHKRFVLNTNEQTDKNLFGEEDEYRNLLPPGAGIDDINLTMQYLISSYLLDHLQNSATHLEQQVEEVFFSEFKRIINDEVLINEAIQACEFIRINNKPASLSDIDQYDIFDDDGELKSSITYDLDLSQTFDSENNLIPSTNSSKQININKTDSEANFQVHNKTISIDLSRTSQKTLVEEGVSQAQISETSTRERLIFESVFAMANQKVQEKFGPITSSVNNIPQVNFPGINKQTDYQKTTLQPLASTLEQQKNTLSTNLQDTISQGEKNVIRGRINKLKMETPTSYNPSKELNKNKYGFWSRVGAFALSGASIGLLGGIGIGIGMGVVGGLSIFGIGILATPVAVGICAAVGAVGGLILGGIAGLTAEAIYEWKYANKDSVREVGEFGEFELTAEYDDSITILNNNQNVVVTPDQVEEELADTLYIPNSLPQEQISALAQSVPTRQTSSPVVPSFNKQRNTPKISTSRFTVTNKLNQAQDSPSPQQTDNKRKELDYPSDNSSAEELKRLK